MLQSLPLTAQPSAPVKQAQETQTQETKTQLDSKAPRKGPSEPDAFLKRLFKVAAEVPNRRARRALKEVLSDPATFHFQLIVTELNPKTRALTPHEYRVDLDYIYPASAIKTFASLASLMYFEELSRQHPWLDINDPLSFHPTRCEHRDKSNLSSGLMTLAHEIKQTQLVSSNRAFNHVFDVVGSERLHHYLIPLFPSLRVYHRLSTSETHEETLTVPPLSVCDLQASPSKRAKKSKRGSSKKRLTLRAQAQKLSDKNAPTLPGDAPYTGYGASRDSLKVGVAYRDAKSKERVEEPMDFSWKNRVSFYDFQRLMYALSQPNQTLHAFGAAMSLKQAHPLHARDLNALRHAMITYPHDAQDPQYQGAWLSETRFKPLIRGLRLSDKATDAHGEGRGPLADHNLYYMNKAGKALGFHLDNALIGVASGELKLNSDHTASNLTRAVYVTVGLYVNKDGVLNDDRYEYKTISVPLFDAIGYALGRYLQDDF